MNPSKVDRNRVVVLTDLPNIGEAGAEDFRLLGIYNPSQLVGKCPFEMYEIPDVTQRAAEVGILCG